MFPCIYQSYTVSTRLRSQRSYRPSVLTLSTMASKKLLICLFVASILIMNIARIKGNSFLEALMQGKFFTFTTLIV